MRKKRLSRRGFLRRSLAALFIAGCSRSTQSPPVEMGLPDWYARERQAATEEQDARTRKTVAANDRIRVAVIGAGTRGSTLISRCRSFPQVELTAVCDVDGRRAEEAVTAAGNRPPTCRDFRDLLSRRDIDAFVIATPDHWHALIAIPALKAGKDVYCEKPLSLTIAEGRAIVQAARRHGRILQVGSQQRSEEPQFHLACELVRNGRLGKLKTIHALVGSNPVGGPFSPATAPPELDWELWLGPAPKADYIVERCRGWRGWYEYGGGRLTDWGAHHLDIAQWALDMDAGGPVAIEATGASPSVEPECYNIHPTFQVTYTYANRVTVRCTSDQNGVRFDGEDGRWIFVSRARNPVKASDAGIVTEPLTQDAVRLPMVTDHFGNFLDCVRSRQPPLCDVAIGHRSATVCHLGVIALRSGKRLRWDASREEFIGDADAKAWLSRPMRPPWKLEA